MIIRMSRPYHHGDLRNALLDAARAVLEERGPSGLTLRETARKVGAAAPSAYHHFTNLEELAAALAEQGFAELTAALEAMPADERGRLAPLGLAYIAWARRNPALYRLMFGDSFGSAIGSNANIAKSRARTQELVVGGLRRQLNERDVPAAVLLAWSLVHGLALLLIDGQAGLETEAMIPDIFRLVARGIPLGPPTPSGKVL